MTQLQGVAMKMGLLLGEGLLQEQVGLLAGHSGTELVLLQKAAGADRLIALRTIPICALHGCIWPCK